MLQGAGGLARLGGLSLLLVAAFLLPAPQYAFAEPAPPATAAGDEAGRAPDRDRDRDANPAPPRRLVPTVPIVRIVDIGPGGSAEAAIRVYDKWVREGADATKLETVMHDMYLAAEPHAAEGKHGFKTVAHLIQYGIAPDQLSGKEPLAHPQVADNHSVVMAGIREQWIEQVILDVGQKNKWKIARSDSGNVTSGMKSDLDQTFYVWELDEKTGGWIRNPEKDNAFIDAFREAWDARHPGLSLEHLDIASIEGRNRFPDPRLVRNEYSKQFDRTIQELRHTPGAYTTQGAVVQQMQFRALLEVLKQNPRAFQEYGPPADGGAWTKLPFDGDRAIDTMFGIEPDLMPGHAFGAALADYLELQHYMDAEKFETKYHLRTWEDALMVLALVEDGKGKAVKVDYARLNPEQRRELNERLLRKIFPDDPKLPAKARDALAHRRELHALALDISADLRLVHKNEPGVTPRFDALARKLYDTESPTPEQLQQVVRDHRRLASEFCLESAYAASGEAFKLLIDPDAKGSHAFDVERYRHLLPPMDEGEWAGFKQRAGDGATLTFLYGIYDLGAAKSFELVRRLGHENPGQAAKLAALWVRGRLQPVEMFWRQPDLHLAQMRMRMEELSGRVQRHVAEELGFEHVRESKVIDGMLETHKLNWSLSKFADNVIKDPGKLDALGQILTVYVQTKGDADEVGRAIVQQLVLAAPVAGQVFGAVQAASEGDWQGLGLMAAAVEVPIIGQGLLVYSLGQSGYAIYEMEYARHVVTNAEDAVYRGFLGPEKQAYGDSVRAQFTDADEKALAALKQRLAAAPFEAQRGGAASGRPPAVLGEPNEIVPDAETAAAMNRPAYEKIRAGLEPRIQVLEMKKRAWEEYHDQAWAGGYFSEWGAQKEQKPFEHFLLKDVKPVICCSPAGVVDFRATYGAADDAKREELRRRIEQAMHSDGDSAPMLRDLAEFQELELRKSRFERAQRYLARAGLAGGAPAGGSEGALPAADAKRTVPELRLQIQRDSLYPYFVEILKEPVLDRWVERWFKDNAAVFDELLEKRLLNPDLTTDDTGTAPPRLLGMPLGSVDHLKDRLRADFDRSQRLYEAYRDAEKKRALREEAELKARIEHYRATAAGATAARLWGDPKMRDLLDAIRHADVVRAPPKVKATVYRMGRRSRPDSGAPAEHPKSDKVDFRIDWSVEADPTLYFGPYRCSVDLLDAKAARTAVESRSVGGTPIAADAADAIQEVLSRELPPAAKPGGTGLSREGGAGTEKAKESDLLIPIVRVWASGMPDLSKADPATLARLPGMTPVLQRVTPEGAGAELRRASAVEQKRAVAEADVARGGAGAPSLCMGAVVCYGSPSSPDVKCKLLSFAAKSGNAQYTLECVYELSEDCDYVGFNFYEDGDTHGTWYHPGVKPPLSIPKAPDPQYAKKGRHTAVFGPFAADMGEPKRILLRIRGKDNAELASSEEITVAIPRNAWILEGVRLAKGTAEFADEVEHLQFNAAIEGTSLHVTASREDSRDHRRKTSTTWIGPMASAIPHGAQTGFWWEHGGWDAYGYFDVHVDIPADSAKSLGSLNGYPVAKDFKGELERARKIGMPDPHFMANKVGEGYASLKVFGALVDPLITNSVEGVTGQEISPERVKIVCTIKMGEALALRGGVKFQECVFEWVYRKGTVPPNAPMYGPAAGGPGVATAGGTAGVGGSPGAGGTGSGGRTGAGAGATGGAGGGGANPWGDSLNTARAGAGQGTGSAAVGAGAAGGNPWQPAVDAAHAGTGTSGGLTPEQMLASPTPWVHAPVQIAMDEWLRSARVTPVNGMQGSYDEWGVLAYGAAQRLHPDNKGMTRHQYLWTTCLRLTSVDRCTLGDYVRIKLTGGSLDACRGAGAASAGGGGRTPAGAGSATAGGGSRAGQGTGAGERPPEPVGPAEAGKPMPEFELADASGVTFRLSDQKGKVVVLNCAGLVLEDSYRVLERIQRAAGAGRVRVAAIEFANGDLRKQGKEAEYRKQLQDDLRSKKISVPLLVDWGGAFRERVVPGDVQSFVVVDREGVVRLRLATGKPAPRPEFRAALKDLLPDVDWDAELGPVAAPPKPPLPNAAAPGADTPEAAFEAIRKAGAGGDWKGYYEMQSPAARKRMEDSWAAEKAGWKKPGGEAARDEQAARIGVSGERLAAMSNLEMCAQSWSRMPAARDRWKSATLVGKTGEGDRCEVRVRSGATEASLVMVRVGGRWYWDPEAKPSQPPSSTRGK